MADYNVGVDTSTLDSLMNTVQNMQQSISSSMSSLAQTMAATTTSAVTSINSAMTNVGGRLNEQMGMNSMSSSGMYGSLNPIPINGSAANSIYYGQGFAGSLLGASGYGAPPTGLTGSEYQYMSMQHQSQSLIRSGMAGVATMATSLAPMVLMDMAQGNPLGEGSTLGTLGTAARWMAGKAPGATLTAAGALKSAAGVAMRIGEASLPIAGYAAAAELASDTYGSLQENWDIQDTLERNSFRYFRGNAGRGFKRKDRQELAGFVQELGVSSMTANGSGGIEDIMEIMKRPDFNSYMVGTKDIEDFKTKMEHLVKNVKQTALTLNESFKQATDTIMDLKRMGIADDASIMTATTGLRAAGIASGFTSQEVMGMSKNIGQMFMGTNISQGVVMPVVQTATAMFAAAKENGNISDTLLANVGGFQSAAQRVTALSADFMKNNQNMQSLFAAMLDEKTGAIDKSKLDKFMQGGQSEIDVRIEGAAKLSTPQMQAMLRAKMPELMQAAAPQMLALMGSSAMKTKDTLMLTKALSEDMAEREAFVGVAHGDQALGEILQGMYKGGQQGIQRMVDARAEDERRQAWQKQYDKRSWAGWIRKNYAEGVEELSSGFKSVSNYLSNKAEDFSLYMAGMERFEESPLAKYSPEQIREMAKRSKPESINLAHAKKQNSFLENVAKGSGSKVEYMSMDELATLDTDNKVIGSVQVIDGKEVAAVVNNNSGYFNSFEDYLRAQDYTQKTVNNAKLGPDPDGDPSSFIKDKKIRAAFSETRKGDMYSRRSSHSIPKDLSAAANLLSSPEYMRNAAMMNERNVTAILSKVEDVKAPMVSAGNYLAVDSLKNSGIVIDSRGMVKAADVTKMSMGTNLMSPNTFVDDIFLQSELKSLGVSVDRTGRYFNTKEIMDLDTESIYSSAPENGRAVGRTRVLEAKKHLEEVLEQRRADVAEVRNAAKPLVEEYESTLTANKAAATERLAKFNATAEGKAKTIAGFVEAGEEAQGALFAPARFFNKSASAIGEFVSETASGAGQLAARAGVAITSRMGRAGTLLEKGASTVLGWAEGGAGLAKAGLVKGAPALGAVGGWIEGGQFGKDISKIAGVSNDTGDKIATGASIVGALGGVVNTPGVAGSLGLGNALMGEAGNLSYLVPGLGAIGGAMSGWNTGANIANYMGWESDSMFGIGARMIGGVAGGILGATGAGWVTGITSAATSFLEPAKKEKVDGFSGNWLTNYALNAGYADDVILDNGPRKGFTRVGTIGVGERSSYDILTGGDSRKKVNRYARSADIAAAAKDLSNRMDGGARLNEREYADSKGRFDELYTDRLNRFKGSSTSAQDPEKLKSIEENEKTIENARADLRSSDAETVARAEQTIVQLQRANLTIANGGKEVSAENSDILRKQVKLDMVKDRQEKGIVDKAVTKEELKNAKEILKNENAGTKSKNLKEDAANNYSNADAVKLETLRKAYQDLYDSDEYKNASAEQKQKLAIGKFQPVMADMDAETLTAASKMLGIGYDAETGNMNMGMHKKGRYFSNQNNTDYANSILARKEIEEATRKQVNADKKRFDGVADGYYKYLGKGSKESAQSFFGLGKDMSGMTEAGRTSTIERAQKGFNDLYTRYRNTDDETAKSNIKDALGETFKKAADLKDKFIDDLGKASKGGKSIKKSEIAESVKKAMGFGKSQDRNTVESEEKQLAAIMSDIGVKGGEESAYDKSEVVYKLANIKQIDKKFLDDAISVRPSEGGVQHKDVKDSSGSSLAPEESKAIATWTQQMTDLAHAIAEITRALPSRA